jgi:hypothetical protein
VTSPDRAPGPPPLPPAAAPADAAALKERFAKAVGSALEVDAGAAGCFANAALVALVVSAASLVLLPLALFLYPRWRKMRTLARVFRAAEAFSARAAPVMAYPLMVNRALRSPGNDPSAGLVLISFEPAGNSLQFMADLAVKVGEGTAPDLSAADREFCERLMDEEQYVMSRRRRLPPTVTGGPTVYACDLAIAPQLLERRHIPDDSPLVPCVAEPGDSGRICQMPFWVVMNQDAPDAEATEAFSTMILAVSGADELARHAR